MCPPAGCNFICSSVATSDDSGVWSRTSRVEMEDIFQLFNLLPVRKE